MDVDSDGDSIEDFLDTDSDNDSVSDAMEGGFDTGEYEEAKTCCFPNCILAVCDFDFPSVVSHVVMRTVTPVNYIFLIYTHSHVKRTPLA